MRIIGNSELIINDDGTIFHLHLKPEELSDKIVVMGDPERVSFASSFFDSIESEASNREFHTITGIYKGKRITVLSHGIGTDNIDIVLTELDALANIDFNKRIVKDKFTQLTIVRVGTSGAIHPSTPVGSFVVSEKSIGFDGLIHYYASSENIRDKDFEKKLINYLDWPNNFCNPYVINADKDLLDKIGFDMIKGATISAIGFYGPQGRHIRLPLAIPDMNSKIESFRYEKYLITNYEMEGSAVAGLSKLMGHKALTVCLIIANRATINVNINYTESIGLLIKKIFDRI